MIRLLPCKQSRFGVSILPLLPFLFLVFFSVCFCAASKNVNKSNVNITVFEEATKVYNGSNGNSFALFRLPYLVAVDGGVLAFAEAVNTANTSKDTSDIVTIFINTTNGLNLTTTGESMAIVSTDIAFNNFAAAVKNGDIVLHAWKSNLSAHGTKGDNGYQGSYKLYKIKVEDATNGGKKIQPEEVESNKSLYNETPETTSTLSVNRAEERNISIGENAVFFPATYNSGTGMTPTVAYLDKNGFSILLLESKLPSDCFDPSVFEWEKGKLLMITSCGNGHRRVYESSDSGRTWTENLSTLSRVWGNAPEGMAPTTRGSFATANISGTKVLLFAQPVIRGRTPSGQLRLWMTDGTHVYNAELISEENRNYSVGSLLYNDGKLYSLFEVSEGGKQKIMLAELTRELSNIKYALRMWNALQKNLSKHCNAYGVSSDSYDGKCDNPIPTDGLVGFLSGRSNNTHWKDEYLCVSAALKGGTKIPNGMRFRGAGAGARWPVGTQGQNQRYHFANYGFTLAATLAIHQRPIADAPLLGASLSDQNAQALLGVSVSSDNKWKIMKKNGGSETLSSPGNWELHKTYHVAIVMQNGTGAVYVDGQKVWNYTGLSVAESLSENVSHFYIGGNHDEKNNYTYVSVGNVFLYNRGLSFDEARTLNQSRITIPMPLDITAPKATPATIPTKNRKNDQKKNTTTRPNKAPTLSKAPIPTTDILSTERKEQYSGKETSVDATDPPYVNYGSSTYDKGIHNRREVQLTPDMLEDMKFYFVNCAGDSCFHDDGTHATAHIRLLHFFFFSVLGLLTF